MILVSRLKAGLSAGKVSLKGEVTGMQPWDWRGGAVSCVVPAFDLCRSRRGAFLVLVT
jgi:hypothetical protein